MGLMIRSTVHFALPSQVHVISSPELIIMVKASYNHAFYHYVCVSLYLYDCFTWVIGGLHASRKARASPPST
jgi:hypothetical protein